MRALQYQFHEEQMVLVRAHGDTLARHGEELGRHGEAIDRQGQVIDELQSQFMYHFHPPSQGGSINSNTLLINVVQRKRGRAHQREVRQEMAMINQEVEDLNNPQVVRRRVDFEDEVMRTSMVVTPIQPPRQVGEVVMNVLEG
nr:hypothetical protein Iba_chr11eCG10500 [Ipomoea batatas]